MPWVSLIKNTSGLLTIGRVELKLLGSRELSQTLNLFVSVCPKDRSSDPSLLYVLHVNDLSTVAHKCSTLMYANDSVLFYSGKVAATIEKSLNEDLDLIGSWFCDNSLFLNTVKTEAMLFRTRARPSDANFGKVFKGRPIKRVCEFKYLGVVSDEHISWNSHVNYVCPEREC